MTIRSFNGKSYIVGWFKPEGGLCDIQQYETAEMARECAADIMSPQYQTFIGVITDATEYIFTDAKDQYEKVGTPIETDKRYEYGHYLQLLIEVQKAGHDVHSEINEVLGKMKEYFIG